MKCIEKLELSDVVDIKEMILRGTFRSIERSGVRAWMLVRCVTLSPFFSFIKRGTPGRAVITSILYSLISKAIRSSFKFQLGCAR